MYSKKSGKIGEGFGNVNKISYLSTIDITFIDI